MAKKASRRTKRGIRLSEAQLRLPGADTVAPVEKAAADPAAEPASGLAEEYRYVTADLRRIAVIAALMLAVLIVLALALP